MTIPITQVTMFDSTNPADIPAYAEAVLGYLDGSVSKWPEGAQNAFPRATLISVEANPEADGWDVETGNAPLSQVAPIAKTAAQTRWCFIYCNVSTEPAVSEAIGGFANPENFPAPGIYWGAADWTGTPHNVPNALFTQYADPATSGGHYDLSSVVAADFPPLTAKPEPAPAPAPVDPAPPIAPDSPLIREGSTGEAVKELQEDLNYVDGAGLKVDGNDGPLTTQADKNFEAKEHIAVDGVYGPENEAKMKEAGA